MENYPRHKKSAINLWVANDNRYDKVYAANITVNDSWYYKPCPAGLGRLYFEKRRGEIFTNGGPDITELTQWTPKQEFHIKFDWDGCGITPPEINCQDFP